MRRALVLLSALLISTAPVGISQSPDAPPLSTTSVKLFGHHLAEDTTEIAGFANTLAVDGDDTAMGPSASCTQNTGQAAVDELLVDPAGTAVDRTYTFVLDPPQTGTVKLDAAQKIKTVSYVGSSTCFGKVDVIVTLKAGTTTIATGTVAGHKYYKDGSDNKYKAAPLEMSISQAEFALEEFTWTIQVKGKHWGQVFLGVSEEKIGANVAKGGTHIELPIVSVGGVAGGPIVEDVQGAFERTHSHPTATTQDVIYNWTTEGGEHNLSVAGAMTEGLLQVTLGDGETELYNESLSGDLSVSEVVAVTSGVWTLRLSFSDAVGNVTIGLAPTLGSGPGSPSGSSTTGPENATTSPANETGAAKSGDGGGIPVPLYVAVVAVAAAVAWRRRSTR